MDIDEFLDKEVVDIDNNTNEDSAYIETSISNDPAEKQNNLSSFEDLKNSLGRATLKNRTGVFSDVAVAYSAEAQVEQGDL